MYLDSIALTRTLPCVIEYPSLHTDDALTDRRATLEAMF